MDLWHTVVVVLLAWSCCGVLAWHGHDGFAADLGRELVERGWAARGWMLLGIASVLPLYAVAMIAVEMGEWLDAW